MSELKEQLSNLLAELDEQPTEVKAVLWAPHPWHREEAEPAEFSTQWVAALGADDDEPLLLAA